MTSFDLLVVAVLVLSTGFAVVRGALREIGTLAALGAAAGVAVLLVRPLQGALGVGESFMATAAIGGALVAVGFILFYILLHFGLKRVPLEGRALTADRVGGGVFGFARGLVLIGLGFLAYGYYLDEARRPPSVTRAATLPMAASMARLFESFAPADTTLDPSSFESDKSNAAVEGYGRTDRSALSEIMTTVTTSDETNGAGPATKSQSADDPIAAVIEESDPE